jgi:methyl-accepting chemotaxis protein
MSIRNKLLAIVIGFVVLIGVSFGLFLAFQLPIQKMEAERYILHDYEASILSLQVQTNCILTRPTLIQLGIFEEAIKTHDAAYEKLSKLSSLPKVSKESAQAFKSTLALKALYYVNVGNVFQNMTDAYEQYKPDMEFNQVKILTDLRDRASVDTSGLMLYIRKVTTERDAAYEALTLADKKARLLIDTAAAGIASARTRVTLFTLIAMLLFVAVGVFFVGLLTKRMMSSIRSIQKAISVMAEGRIGDRIADLGKDELGAVSRDLNRLNDQMGSALSRIKVSANKNGDNAVLLGESVMEFSSSAYEIEKNSEMIGGQMGNVDRLAGKALADMESIAVAIASLDKGIENQAALVADSGAAVSQMLASIENIARITQVDSKAADELSVQAEKGMSVVDGTFAKVAEIGSSVDDIQEMVQIISDIAGQTNLLAMNAEIEAAHAGEAGKGFSVVAGEIRNLAEAAGTSSREIDGRTKTIIETIEGAAAARKASIGVLKEIIDRIQAVARSVAEIYANVAEIKVGSRQIQESVEALRGVSESIEKESSAVAARAESTRVSFVELGRISHETTAGVGEMGNGLAQVSKSLKDLSSMVESIGEVGTEMKKATDAFTIGS